MWHHDEFGDNLVLLEQTMAHLSQHYQYHRTRQTITYTRQAPSVLLKIRALDEVESVEFLSVEGVDIFEFFR